MKRKYHKKGDAWVSNDGATALGDWSEESRAAALEARKAGAKERPGPQAALAHLKKLKEDYESEGRENGWNHPRTRAIEGALLRAQKAYGVVHRGSKDGEPAGHPFRGNQYTSGEGSGSSEPTGAGRQPAKVQPLGHGYSKEAFVDAKGVIHTTKIDDAVRALYEKRKVELNQPREVSTLLDRLGKVAAEMIKLGGEKLKLNLCDVSVKGTNLFCAESLGIKREKMPQLDDAQTAAFSKLMSDTYGAKNTSEKASYLRATQDQLDGVKVAKAAKSMQTDPVYAARRIIVSKDNYILDGHHSWAAHIGLDALNGIIGDKDMNVTRVNIPIIKLLEEAETFTGGKGHKALGDKAMNVRRIFAKLVEDGALDDLVAKILADMKKCPICDGAGKDDGGFKCKTCDGEGYVADARRTNAEEDDDDEEENDDENYIGDSDTTIRLTDNCTLEDAKPRRTADGYLVTSARIARTGIQAYGGAELGRPDMDVVRVYRPEAEVFGRAAMKSLAHKPITLTHPPCMVDSSNWAEYAVGQIGEDVTRDGDCVRVPMVIMDANAIRAYERDGVKELSVGYSTDLKWGVGRTKDGQIYDAKQTAIRGNHLAVVPAARGGSRLRIGDTDKGDDTMVKVLIAGQSIEFHDELAAKHVESYIASQQKTITDQSKKLEEEAAEEEQENEKKTRGAKDAAAALKGEVAALTKQLEDAKAKLTDAALDKVLQDRLELRMKANAVLDGKVDLTGKSDAEVRRIVVMAKLGDTLKDLPDAEMVGAFKYAIADIKQVTGTDRLADSLSLLQLGGSRNDPKALKDAAYEEYVKNLNNAWKTPPRVSQ